MHNSRRRHRSGSFLALFTSSPGQSLIRGLSSTARNIALRRPQTASVERSC